MGLVENTLGRGLSATHLRHGDVRPVHCVSKADGPGADNRSHRRRPRRRDLHRCPHPDRGRPVLALQVRVGVELNLDTRRPEPKAELSRSPALSSRHDRGAARRIVRSPRAQRSFARSQSASPLLAGTRLFDAQRPWGGQGRCGILGREGVEPRKGSPSATGPLRFWKCRT